MTSKRLKKTSPLFGGTVNTGHKKGGKVDVNVASRTADRLYRAVVNAFPERMRYNPSLVTLTAGVATNACGIDLTFPYWDGR